MHLRARVGLELPEDALLEIRFGGILNFCASPVFPFSLYIVLKSFCRNVSSNRATYSVMDRQSRVRLLECYAMSCLGTNASQ